MLTEFNQNITPAIAKIAAELFTARDTQLLCSSGFFLGLILFEYVLIVPVCRDSAHIFTIFVPACDILVAMKRAVPMAQLTPPKTIAYLNEP